MTDRSDDLFVREFLAPLAEIEPVHRRRPAASRGWGRGAAALGLAAFAMLALGAGYGVWDHLGAERRSPLATGERFACAGVVGRSAADAEAFFAARGLAVSWRYVTYRPHRAGDPVEAYSDPRDAVPGAAVVEDLAWQDERTMIVFVRGRGDANAPPLERPECAAR